MVNKLASITAESDTPVASIARKDRDDICLVFGASGYIGRHLVPYLTGEGHRVRAAVRNRTSIAALHWPDVEIVEADALAPATLSNALQDVTVAFYLVHSMAAGRNFARIDQEAAGNFADAAARAGVRRIIYLGGLAPDDAESEHIVSRRETGEILRRGQVPVTEIRAGIIVGPGSAAFEVMRDLVYHLPVMVTPRWVRAKSPPIALENLLAYLERSPWIDELASLSVDAAGPETLTYTEMMRVIASAAGKRPPLVIPVPVLTPRLSAYWLRFVTSVPTNVARALIEGLRHDFVADDTLLRRLVPQRLLSFQESVLSVLDSERHSTPVTRWIEGAFIVRNERIDYAYYAKRASGSCDTSATPAAVWRVVAAIGGDNRYYYLNSLWSIREWLDWAVGGPGLKRGRRDPQHIQTGERIDHWRVLGAEPERRLSLAFGMRAPGAGVLEFELEPTPRGGTRLTATAFWHPAGIWGLLYWYSLEPMHRIVFKGLTREICRRAERDREIKAPTDSTPS
ncbi:MAG: SDR family oxidoreductase [Sphingobacteriia bacterium]|nr:SDR family oxidoreductase [Sphingobacteriia bacterium]NCC40928.1 SDR family oxidoreductase [Gammaproteobacteria bacterium]